MADRTNEPLTAVSMLSEIRPHFAIRADNLADQVGAGDGGLQLTGRARRAGDQAFKVEFICVNHQPDHRLLIIGIAANVGEHEQPRALAGKRYSDRQEQ